MFNENLHSSKKSFIVKVFLWLVLGFMEPPSLIRYIIPLLVLVHGIQCAGTPSTTKSPTTTTPFPGYRDPTFADIANEDNKDFNLNKLDVFHMDDKCGIAHFAYAKTNWYSNMTGPSTINMLNSTSSCPKATQTFVMVSDGAQFYKISLKNDGDKTPFNFELFQIPPLSGRPVSKGSVAVTWNDFQSTEKSNISSCFHDLGSLYCLRIRDNSNFNKNNRLVFHRFTKHGIDKTSFLVHSGVLNFPVKHDIDKGGQPRNILYDVQSGDIIVSFDKQAGIIANEYDVRSLYGLGDRGALFKAVFPLDKAIGVATHNGFQFFLVTKHENSTYGYTFYYITANDKAHARRGGYTPTISGNAKGADWQNKFGQRVSTRVAMYFRQDTQPFSELINIALSYCKKVEKDRDDCFAVNEGLSSRQTIMIIVCSVLIFFFVLLVVLLVLYLLCCVKTKRRRRKHRKHRKHRPLPRAPTVAKSEEDVEIDPSKMTHLEEEPKKEENKVIKKIKAFGGVDYSSSSDDDVEHSQAYFSARDQFDLHTAAVAASKRNDGNQNIENAGPAAGDATSTHGDVTGGPTVPEEHDLQDKNNTKGPRSVYMKPKKKKK